MRAGRVVVVVLAATLLAGCAASPTLDDATGAELQAGVVTAANAASAGDAATALAELDALEQTLLQTTADGRVTADRSAKIAAAIALVRSDLDALLASQQPPAEPAPEPEPEPDVAPTEPSDAPQPEDEDEGGKGPGNENGPGNGNGKDKENGKDKKED